MNLKSQKLKMMENEKIPNLLIKMGVPIMIGMVVSAFYSVVDAYFVGGLGTSEMGAVSITFPIAQVIIGLGMSFGNGAASYVSRLLGEKNYKRADVTASTAIIMSLFVGFISIFMSLLFLDKILIFLGATKGILPYAREFAVIYITGSILNIFNVTMNNIVMSYGMARLTMISMLLSAVINIVLNPVFIYTFGFGIRGSAISTVISQAAASFLYVNYLLKKDSMLKFSIHSFRFDRIIFNEILKVGIPIFAYQLLSSISMGLYNTAASKYNDSAVAAIGVVTRIMTLGSYVIFGFMKGYQPIAGYNYGAKKYGRLKEATKVSLKWSTIFCVFVSLIFIFIPNEIVSLFSKNDAALISIGERALRANGFIFSFFGFEQVYMSIFLALGKSRRGGILSISRQGLFFIPAIFIMPRLFGINGIIFVQPVADIFTVILTAVFMISLNKELKVLEKNTNVHNINVV